MFTHIGNTFAPPLIALLRPCVKFGIFVSFFVPEPVSISLTVVVGGFVESLKAQEVHLAPFQTQVFLFRQPSGLGLDTFDRGIG